MEGRHAAQVGEAQATLLDFRGDQGVLRLAERAMGRLATADSVSHRQVVPGQSHRGTLFPAIRAVAGWPNRVPCGPHERPSRKKGVPAACHLRGTESNCQTHIRLGSLPRPATGAFDSDGEAGDERDVLLQDVQEQHRRFNYFILGKTIQIFQDQVTARANPTRFAGIEEALQGSG